MNTKIIDKRSKVIDTRFSDLRVGEFFQDTDEETWDYDDRVCMKIDETTILRILSNGQFLKKTWARSDEFVLPLKATITVEVGD